MRRLPGWEHDRGGGKQPDAAELVQVILRMNELSRPKPAAPRLKTSSPSAHSEFNRQWGEFARDGTAVDDDPLAFSIMTYTCRFRLSA